MERYSAGFEKLSAQRSTTWRPWVLVILTVWSFLRRKAMPLLAGRVCGVDIFPGHRLKVGEGKGILGNLNANKTGLIC